MPRTLVSELRVDYHLPVIVQPLSNGIIFTTSRSGTVAIFVVVVTVVAVTAVVAVTVVAVTVGVRITIGIAILEPPSNVVIILLT